MLLKYKAINHFPAKSLFSANVYVKRNQMNGLQVGLQTSYSTDNCYGLECLKSHVDFYDFYLLVFVLKCLVYVFYVIIFLS